MQKPEIVLRADAGSATGFGHIMRTCALASYLRDDFRCMVACRNDADGTDKFVDGLISDAGAERIRIAASDDFDRAFLAHLSPERIAVLDNYYYGTDYQREVRERSRALVSVDDVADRHFVSDVFFTPSPLSRSDFSLEPYTLFRGGVEWAFLREPFLTPAPRRSATKVRRAIIAMGGADPFRLTDMIIGILTEIDRAIRIDVIAGPAAAVSAAESDTLRIIRRAGAAEIAATFDAADIGIFPASTICVEAMSRKLPVAAGWYADNQLPFYRRGVEEGWLTPLGDLRRGRGCIAPVLADVAAGYGRCASPDFDFIARRNDIIKIFKDLWQKKLQDA